jgi:hypothetical protein
MPNRSPSAADAVQTISTLLDPIAPGGYVAVGLPAIPLADDVPAEGDAAGAVRHVLASAAGARARMAWTRADTLAREGVALARRLRIAAGPALIESAAARIHAGRLDDAETACAEALDDGDGPTRAAATINLGIVAALRGDADEALARFAAAEPADEWTHFGVAVNRSMALAARLELPAAHDAAADALRLGRRARDDHRAALGGIALACVHHARGTRNEARTRVAEALRALVRAGDRLRIVQCHYLLGELAYEAEDGIRAGSHYRDGLAVAREAGAAPLVELLTLRFEHR